MYCSAVWRLQLRTRRAEAAPWSRVLTSNCISSFRSDVQSRWVRWYVGAGAVATTATSSTATAMSDHWRCSSKCRSGYGRNRGRIGLDDVDPLMLRSIRTPRSVFTSKLVLSNLLIPFIRINAFVRSSASSSQFPRRIPLRCSSRNVYSDPRLSLSSSQNNSNSIERCSLLSLCSTSIQNLIERCGFNHKYTTRMNFFLIAFADAFSRFLSCLHNSKSD